jgi:hypothetical protein
MSSPERAIEFYASMNYGHLISVDAPIYDERKGLYISNLHSDYPLVIKNEKPPERKTWHFLEISSLGHITSDKNGKIIKERTTSRDECIRNILSFFKLWKRRAEEIVVYATSDKLVKGLRWYHFLDPIDEIVDQLWESECIDEFEIDYGRSRKRRKKTRQYLALLEGLKIVTRRNGNYFEGNLAITARNEAKGDKRYFRDLLVSTVLKERYSTLRDVFHLTILDPVVRVDNTVYIPEIETEVRIYRTFNSIRRDFKHYYNYWMNKNALKRNLEQLVDFGIIKRKGPYYFGDRDLLGIMIEKKKELGSINKALMARA